jgi:excisionase family DNA binding protein
MTPLLVTIDEAADLLSISRGKLYQLIQTGELPTVRIGRAVRIPFDALEQWAQGLGQQDTRDN